MWIDKIIAILFLKGDSLIIVKKKFVDVIRELAIFL